MTDITPIPDWTAVRQIETTDKVLGGPLPEGVANLHAQALANQNALSRLFAGLPFDPEFTAQVGGFPIGGKVSLDNGDIVKSTINGNANDPHADMTGWLRVGNTGEVS